MASPSPSISVHTQQNVEVVDDVCRSTMGCAAGDSLSTFLLLTLTGLFAAFVIATILHLNAARSIVDEERDRTVDERDAFARFVDRIADLDADGSGTTAVAANEPLMTMSAAPPDRQLQAVKSAYRETVMSLPHYEEEYDEPIAVNMAAEFGDEVAAAVIDGERLTPPLKSALLQQGRDASDRRRRFVSTLDREAAQLAEAHESLSSVEGTLVELDEEPLLTRTFEELQSTWERLGQLEDRCVEVVEDRQDGLARMDRPYQNGDEGVSLHEYLYRPLSVTYPVLADGATLIDHLRTAQGRVLSALTTRV